MSPEVHPAARYSPSGENATRTANVPRGLYIVSNESESRSSSRMPVLLPQTATMLSRRIAHPYSWRAASQRDERQRRTGKQLVAHHLVEFKDGRVRFEGDIDLDDAPALRHANDIRADWRPCCAAYLQSISVNKKIKIKGRTESSQLAV